MGKALRKIVLPRVVRIFNRAYPNGSLLVQTRMTADAGTEIEVGPVHTMCYDHMDKAVVSFMCPNKDCKETHYLLVEETGLSSKLTN